MLNSKFEPNYYPTYYSIKGATKRKVQGKINWRNSLIKFNSLFINIYYNIIPFQIYHEILIRKLDPHSMNQQQRL